MRVLVDTNVFLDLLLMREENWKDSLKFFSWCRENKNQTFITSMSFRDIEYTAHKFFRDKEKANKVISDAYSLCSKVIGISADSAINAMFEDYRDYEDELLVWAAKESLLDAIITNNTKDFEDRGVPVFTPKQIVNMSNN